MKKLAIITTHPIQYYAPFFKLLTERGKVHPKVFYTWPQAIEGFDDPDFKTKISWDIDLLNGYDWEAVDNVSKAPSSKRWSGIDCPSLNEQIQFFQPDAVLVFGWNLKSHFRAMRHFKGKVPVWFTGDSTLLDERPGWRKWVRRALLTFVYRHIDKALYVGTQNKKYFLAHGVKEEQLYHFPHAIDNDRFADPDGQFEAKAQAWKKELGIPEGTTTLLFAGKLEPKKNPLLLIQAIASINQSSNPQILKPSDTHSNKSSCVRRSNSEGGNPSSAEAAQSEGGNPSSTEAREGEGGTHTTDSFRHQPINLSARQPINPSTLQPINPSTHQPINPSTHKPINLIIVGNGPLEPEITQLAEQHDWLVHLPFQNQSIMPVVYRLGDIFVLPSKGPGETWGLGINEAMACGKPVIASDKVGCAMDLIKNGENGYIFRAGDTKDLEQALEKLLDSDMGRLGNESLAQIQNWSYEHKCEAIEQQFNRT